MGALTREEITRPRPRPVERVDTGPEWGEGSFVYVRLLTGRERDWYKSARYKVRQVGTERKVDWDLVNDTARLCCLALADADGNRLFRDDEVGLVGELEGPALERVYDAASRFNRLGADELEDAKKNSGPTPNGVPSSSSPGAAGSSPGSSSTP